MKKMCGLLMAAVFLFAASAFADNWRWVDDLGVVHFTNDEDVIPEAFKKSAQRVGAARLKTKEEKKAKTASLKYREYGKAMMITIVVNGLKKPFLYDPDSSSTVITHELESELQLKKIPGSEAVAHTPDGALLPIYLVEISRIQLGVIELNNVNAVVKDFEDANIEASGILGMNDLEDYEPSIDSETKTLTLKPLEE
ncbi:MAG: aspartyl protease family protein [Nitrospinae bacterium]|nr:aspartyl protease family protein [Nitrospinota bacterium]